MAKITVIGAGNGGLAFAADLSDRGWSVMLFNRSPERLQNVAAHGAVTLIMDGLRRTATISGVTTNIEEALTWSHLVVVSLPTSAIGAHARVMAPHLEAGHRVLLAPGHTGGALWFRQVVNEVAGEVGFMLGEIHTLPYITRLVAPGEVAIWSRSAWLKVAALPATDTEEFRACFSQAVLNMESGASVLETSLTNVNAVMHPAGMLMNAGWIEHTDGNFKFYVEGITASVGRIVDRVDAERLEIGAAYAVAPPSLYEEFHLSQMIVGERRQFASASDLIKAGDANSEIGAPTRVDDRFLREDVGYGLVPMANLASLAGVEIPTIHALVALTESVGLEPPLRSLTSAEMGLAGMTMSEINRYVSGGQ